MPRLPNSRTIKISLDSQNQFQYTDLFDPTQDLSIIAVMNGDRLAWVLDSQIKERALQIDFGQINPFHIFRPVTLRGHDHIVADVVNFPHTYQGNRRLSYTVSLGNGLHDDPDVVPVCSDPGKVLADALKLDPEFKVEWVDSSDIAIKLDPKETTRSAGGANAIVTWAWKVGQNDPTPPFDLDFTFPPIGWPFSTTHSDPDAITLALPPGPRTKFTITTTSGDGTGTIKAEGHLTVTA